MNAVQKDIEELTKKELAAANEKFPLFSSMHEGYAVILEELQEARDEYENADKVHENMFSCIKGNDTKNAIQSAKALKHFAINGAAELIQVAAMAQKFIDSCESQTEQAGNKKENHAELLQKRLCHLLKSNFISSFDEVDIITKEYKRDIKEADKLGALIDTAENEYKFSTSQLKDLIKDRESFINGDNDNDEIYKNDIHALNIAVSVLSILKSLAEGNEAFKTSNALAPKVMPAPFGREKYWWYCPKCGASRHTNVRNNNCSYCGQQLDWSEYLKEVEQAKNESED